MITTFLTSKLFIFKAYEIVLLPILTLVSLKYVGCLHISYVYSVALIDYAYHYSVYTSAEVAYSSFFTHLYKRFQIVRIANTANAFLNIPTEKFSIEFLKEVYNRAPCYRDSMNYLTAEGISFRMFPEVTNKYFYLSSDSSKVLLAAM